MKNSLVLRLNEDKVVVEGVASGAQDGRHALARLVGVASSSEASVVILDFEGVIAATGSFLREVVVGLRRFVTESEGNRVLILANAASAVEDEIGFLAASLNDAFIVGSLRKGRLTDVRVLGRLEPVQAATLEAVQSQGEADVAILARKVDDSVKPTAWNNRLSALREKGLVVETREGKAKKYRSTLEVVSNG